MSEFQNPILEYVSKKGTRDDARHYTKLIMNLETVARYIGDAKAFALEEFDLPLEVMHDGSIFPMREADSFRLGNMMATGTHVVGIYRHRIGELFDPIQENMRLLIESGWGNLPEVDGLADVYGLRPLQQEYAGSSKSIDAEVLI